MCSKHVINLLMGHGLDMVRFVHIYKCLRHALFLTRISSPLFHPVPLSRLLSLISARSKGNACRDRYYKQALLQ